jgi:NADPH-ferrihemoprotein reductase
MFYGSQTGTAEEYAIRLAKEAKSKFGISSLVCDPEEYDFTKLDAAAEEDKVVFFLMATYGEGDPTDNAQPLVEFLMDDEVQFSMEREGGERLKGLKYVVFGLGNRTYEHFNEVARKLDKRLTELGATRVGERGEGDDDKSMEEDYLAWKDPMWVDFQRVTGIEEGGSGDVADFVVQELSADAADKEKVFHGELSARALAFVGTANGGGPTSGTITKTGIPDAKNPYLAPVKVARELFSVDSDRNCIHVEFDIKDSGVVYQTGDHVGVWPTNPDVEVDRILCVLGLAGEDKRHRAIKVESLDPTLAKIPFPTPATYDAIFRHYLDVSAVASRQTLALLARFAPNAEVGERLSKLGTDKDAYNKHVQGPALKLAEVLQAVAGDDLHQVPSAGNTTVWKDIPFDRIISVIPRLQPRFYSISSSPKLYPDSIHITAVVLKYESQPSEHHGGRSRFVYGVGTNFIMNVKMAQEGKAGQAPVMADQSQQPNSAPSIVHPQASTPKYKISGPRERHFRDEKYLVPVHVRRSTFRLPTSPKIPIIMIGPGTGVAPFRGFVQERLAAAQRAITKAGAGATPESALKDWAEMFLFYGCRKEDEDYLYRDEWPEYQRGLGGKLNLEVAVSRSERRKPDGSESTMSSWEWQWTSTDHLYRLFVGKVYVQDLLWDARDKLVPLILEKRAYIYICGDAKNMAHSVEQKLMAMLGEAKGGSAEVEGAKEFKLLKERQVSPGRGCLG